METPPDVAPAGAPASAAVGALDAERDAVLALIAPHWPLVVGLARRLAPADRSDDVLRETVRSAWRHREQFDPSGAVAPTPAQVRTWLLAVVADEARERTPRVKHPEPDATSPEQRVAGALDELGLAPDAIAAVLGSDPARVEQLLAARPRTAADPADGRRPEASDEPTVALEPLLVAAARRRPRRSRATWIAVAAVIALGIAVPVVAVLTRSGGGGHANTATQIVQVADAGFTGAVTDPSDLKRLYVLVTERAGDPPCLLQNPTATVTTQNAQAVTLTVTGQREVPATAAPGQPVTYACRATVYVQVGVELDAPLAGRKVIDSASGKAQPVLDPSTVPTPAYVPTGYTARPVTWQPGQAATAGTDPIPTGWAALRSYDNGTAELDVRVAAPALFVGANPIGHATVSGRAATITQSGGTLCVTWSPSAQRAVQVCSETSATVTAASSAPAAQPDVAPLDQDQLLRVARSLP